jgi:hypothetical protein
LSAPSPQVESLLMLEKPGKSCDIQALSAGLYFSKLASDIVLKILLPVEGEFAGKNC